MQSAFYKKLERRIAFGSFVRPSVPSCVHVVKYTYVQILFCVWEFFIIPYYVQCIMQECSFLFIYLLFFFIFFFQIQYYYYYFQKSKGTSKTGGWCNKTKTETTGQHVTDNRLIPALVDLFAGTLSCIEPTLNIRAPSDSLFTFLFKRLV